MAAGQTEQASAARTDTTATTSRKGAWFKRIGLGLVVVIGVFVLVVAMQPANFRVARSATIAAPPAMVFEQVNDFHNWEAWSPWAKLDPAAKNTFEGPTSGTGAIFRWNGNSEVGEGSMTTTESRPGELVRIKLDFVRPFAGTSDVEFKFEPAGDQTKVTWSMSGENNFIAKAMSLFMDCEAMCGAQFDEGLANMKSVVEGKSTATP
jgi:hypothetical protein